MEYDGEDDDINELVEDFKSMVKYGGSKFFDSDDLQLIIEDFICNFDLEYAGEAIDYAIKLYPASYSFRILRVQKLTLESQYDAARKELDAIERDFAPSADLYIEKIYLAQNTGEDENITEMLNEAYRLDPNHPEINFMLACDYVQKGMISQAIRHIVTAIDADPEIEDQLFKINFQFEEAKDYQGAIIFFKELSDKYPFSQSIWEALGTAYKQQDLFEEAIDAFKFAVSIDEEDSTMYDLIAETYVSMKNYQEAINYFNQAIRLSDEDYRAFAGLGECYHELEQYEKALDNFHKSLILNQYDNNSLWGIIAILFKTHREDEAEAFIQKLFRAHTQNFSMLFKILPFYEDAERIAKLKELAHLTMNLVPDKEEFFLCFATYCSNNQELQKMCIEVLEEYLDNEEVAFSIPYLLAALHFLNKDYTTAVNYLKTALLINYQGFYKYFLIHEDLKSIPLVYDLLDYYKPES